MALGQSTVSNVLQKLKNIENNIKYGNYNTETEALYSCWNTFDYVSKNLGEWANDTIIGQEARQNLTQLSNLLLNLIEETRRINNKIITFCDKQDSVNGSKAQFNNSVVNNITLNNIIDNKELKKEEIIKTTLENYKKRGWDDNTIKRAENYMRNQSPENLLSLYSNVNDFEAHVSVQALP